MSVCLSETSYSVHFDLGRPGREGWVSGGLGGKFGSREAWEGRLGVLVRNLRTVRVVYWVIVSESSGAGSPGCRR